MSASFNLTRRAWIPVESLDGALRELSTREALCEAHSLRGLADPSPTVLASLTRHLLAVLHRAYDGPRSMREWCAIVSAKRFDVARVHAYLDLVEPRMDLLHPELPFAQTRGVREEFPDSVVPIDELELVRSAWGSGRAVFRHRPADPPPTMDCARAARALLAHHAFATGGLVKKPNEPVSATAAPLVSSGVVLLRGETLFDTLVANLLVYNPDQSKPFAPGGERDLCAWEQPPLPRQLRRPDEPKRPLLGYLDLLTWVCRRIELVTEGERVVGFVNAVGQGIAAGAPPDPMTLHRLDEKRGRVAVGLNPARAFWRDANSLFVATQTGDDPLRPKVLDQVSSLDAEEVLGPEVRYSVELLGIAADKSRVDAARVERLRVRARSLADVDLGGEVKEALAIAETAVQALQSALWVYAQRALSPGDRAPDAKDVRALRDSFGAEPIAWSELGVAFEDHLRALQESAGATAESFSSRATRIVRETFERVTDRPDSSGRWLKARALAGRSLNIHLAELRAPSVATNPAAPQEQSP